MSVILSIKPKYVKEIIEGTKKYEFRKVIFKREIKQIYIYSTAPVKKIIGVFSTNQIIEGAPEVLWEKCCETAGISRDDFLEYFRNRELGYAIQISNFKLFKKPKNPQEIKANFTPPQSFVYL